MKWFFIALLAFVCFIPLMFIPAGVFWTCWSWYGLGATYFNFLPTQFHYIPFWDVFLMMVMVSIVGHLFQYKVEFKG